MNSVPLSESMYLRHIWTGRYWFMNVDTMVSTDLLGMGKAYDHPVRKSIMVRMCLLPELEVSHFMTKSMAILSNEHSGISVICRG